MFIASSLEQGNSCEPISITQSFKHDSAEISEAVQGREGESPPFFVPIQGQPTVGYTRPADFFKEMKLSPDQERKRLALWMGKGEVYDPRNEPDFDTFLYGTEPIPGDTTWAKEKAPDGAFD